MRFCGGTAAGVLPASGGAAVVALPASGVAGGGATVAAAGGGLGAGGKDAAAGGGAGCGVTISTSGNGWVVTAGGCGAGSGCGATITGGGATTGAGGACTGGGGEVRLAGVGRAGENPVAHAPRHIATTNIAAMRPMFRGTRCWRRNGDGSMGTNPVQDSGDRAAPAMRGAAGPQFRAEGGTLYVVATPIGNLRDVTLRALDVLGSVDLVAAEDTRVTGNLLRHFGIVKRLLSLHAHNERERAASVVARLRQGGSVALVTDAGTPGVSDPGARLVAAVRAEGLPVVPIPGASAMIAAISAAGLHAERFHFIGFLAGNAKARRALLDTVAGLDCALVLHEAPHRIGATLRELAAALPGREIVIAREITKKFETIVRMPLADAQAWIEADPNHGRGEFVLIVDAARDVREAALDAAGERWLRAVMEHLSPAQAARVAAAATGVARDVLYARALELKPDTDT